MGLPERQAVIVGAGPAGLTAALELLRRNLLRPVVLEKSRAMGGISQTVNYKGNRIDIGGHRFFSKSDRVTDWWTGILPVEDRRDGPDPKREDRVMLVRNRLSRIYFLRKFFDYPISLSARTIRNLGLWQVFLVGLSYLRSAAFPIRNEISLEHFFINRFGRRLYRLFFRSYTEKVWGIPCSQISAAWGAQRVKGLSIYKSVVHVLRKALNRAGGDVSQKQVETSLIERFLYPKYGPGQMWEEVARKVREQGGEILTGYDVIAVRHDGGRRVLEVDARHQETQEHRTFRGDQFFSSMPVRELIAAMDPPAPAEVRRVSDGLVYRDFITVGLLASRLTLENPDGRAGLTVRDNWIYIQEPDVLVGRLQIFNNWSPYLVADPSRVWIGLEYFCNEDDELWRKPDDEMIALAVSELERIDIAAPADILDGTVIRMAKTYPAYFGTYGKFDKIVQWVNRLENLWLVGRNGMHRYNNQDHSMLTAMVAVDNIERGVCDHASVWAVNTEQEYHESRQVESR